METLIWFILAIVIVIAALLVLHMSNKSGETGKTAEVIREELRDGREETRSAGRELREEVSGRMKEATETLSNTLGVAAQGQQTQIEAMAKQLKDLTDGNQRGLNLIRDTLDTRVSELQAGNERKLDQVRQEVTEALKNTTEQMTKVLEAMSASQNALFEGMTTQLKDLSNSNRKELDTIRASVDKSVKELQESNEKKLEEMRKTVDEKLHDTLERRLGESFKLVSERLEAVQNGLGEMKNLANDVGGLQRVLTNVKARGTWAEFQLGGLLEQVLTPEQYGRNVAVKPASDERVEFAVRLPGPKDDPGSQIWLPIDSKFPQEDYIRLQEAADRSDPSAVKTAVEALARSVRNSAKEIHDKYLHPPYTTDFGIMFLATEGLYAEVIRQPRLVDELQQRHRVMVAGPTTLIALLSSLRMGFQTLAIEKRASEVWKVLGAVKTEFGKFGDALEKVKNQLDKAHKSIESTGQRSRVLERKLRAVEELPEKETADILMLHPEAVPEAEETENQSESDAIVE